MQHRPVLSSWTFAETLSPRAADKLSVVHRAAEANLCPFLCKEISPVSLDLLHTQKSQQSKIEELYGKKGSKFNFTVNCHEKEKQRGRERTLLRPVLQRLSSELLSEFYQKRPFKHDHSNEPISHEIDFSDK